MKTEFLEAVKNRRSNYMLSSESPISDERIQYIIETAVMHVPSAFNSQSSRVVLLLGIEHKVLWDMVKETLRVIVPEEAFGNTEAKIDSFKAAYGSILYFEDQDVILQLQDKFPTYAQNFPIWSEQHTGMLQFAIWTALENEGLGVNLQHYNPLIDDKVKENWGIPQSWKLIAQMPFGKAAGNPGEKEYLPIEERFRVIGKE